MLVTWMAAAAQAVTPAPTPRPYSVEDYLSLESLGNAKVVGTLAVWEQAPPYREIGFYGLGHLGAWSGTGFELKALDLAASSARPSRLFPPEGETSYRLDSVSPDGRHVAFYAARRGKFFLGAFDRESGRTTSFEGAPTLLSLRGRESLWISSDEIVFSVYGGEGQPLESARAATSDEVRARHLRAWAGQLSATETSTHVAGAPTWLAGRLCKANVRTGRQEVLANGRFETLKVSADGRFLAALRQGTRVETDSSLANTDWVQTRSQLVVFDLKSGASRIVLPDKEIFLETLSWAMDTNRLAFFAWDQGKGAQSGMYFAFDAESGDAIAWPHFGLDLASERERGWFQKPERVMWIDGRLAVFARRHSGTEAKLTYRDTTRGDPPWGKADWFLIDGKGNSESLTEQFHRVSAVPIHADGKTLTVLVDGAVWRVGPGAAPVKLTGEVGERLYQLRATEVNTRHSPFQRWTVLETRDVTPQVIVIMDLISGRALRVAAPDPEAALLTASFDAGSALFRIDGEDGTELVTVSSDGAKRTVGRLNDHLADVAKTKWSKFSYMVDTASGPRRVDGCVLRPPGVEPERKYPLIVEVYPGRGALCSSTVGRRLGRLGANPGPYSEHLLAAHGYVVLQPNTASELIRTPSGPLGGMTDVVLQAIDALVAQGGVDASRVGLLGFSQGGFASLWVASQTPRFAATVSLNGWSDMYSHYFDSNYLQAVYVQDFGFNGATSRYEAKAGSDFPLGAKPFDSLDAYVRNSPLFQAPRFTAPVLLVHSDLDTFALGQYERMYTALKLQGKPAKLIRYWGEGHGPSSPENIRHLWREIFAWFDRYVRRESAPGS